MASLYLKKSPMLDFHSSLTLPAPSRADRDVANASKGHCTAFAVLGEGAGIRVKAESHLEFCHLLLLNAREDVVDLREQVRFRHRRIEHVFDIVATLATGKTIGFTVKPEIRLLSGRFLEKMGLVTWHARKQDFVDEVRLLTEADIDPVDLHNAKILAAVRRPDPDAEHVARAVASGLVGGRSLQDLTVATGLHARGYRALLRLVRAGVLRTVRHEPITPKTLVCWKGDSE
ncbi:hypothetical protein SAMN05444722_1854 [Rhodovulum sp. ES.010]|nr:hypothetical protein SAMN05444722_1854 [Rhodovulum sp. ES.010]